MFVQRLDKLPSCIPHARARSEMRKLRILWPANRLHPARTDP
jgi:hypothetical protein